MRYEGVERVATGIGCDRIGCTILIPTRNSTSKPAGYYVQLQRVTVFNVWRKSDELFFCSKEHMLEALEWQFSDLTTERLFDDEHSKPKGYPQ